MAPLGVSPPPRGVAPPMRSAGGPREAADELPFILHHVERREKSRLLPLLKQSFLMFRIVAHEKGAKHAHQYVKKLYSKRVKAPCDDVITRCFAL